MVIDPEAIELVSRLLDKAYIRGFFDGQATEKEKGSWEYDLSDGWPSW